MTEHPLLAAIPRDRRNDLLNTVPVGPGLITVTAIPADQWGEREVIARRPDGDTVTVVVETVLMNPDDVPHRVAEFTEALQQVLDRMTPEGATVTDTPMTPDRAPSRREELLFMLLHGGAHSETIARRVVDLALAEAGAEKKAEVDRLRKALSDAADQVAELDDELGKASAHTHFLERNTLPDLHRQIEHHKDGKARWRKRAETAESRLATVERLAEEARDKDNHSIDTDLLLDALGLES